jgi:hypothetical protein
MYYNVAFWTSVAIVKMSYNAAFTNCWKRKFKLGHFKSISKLENIIQKWEPYAYRCEGIL